MAVPLRCHLLIEAPASGKTSLAVVLAELTGAVVLSTDVGRAEFFGDAAVQGSWHDIEAQLHHRNRQSVAAGIPVIVEATHARRPWRLAITQALALPAPVEWIGWWLNPPLATCPQWNQTRQRQVPEAVIREMDAALADPVFGPSQSGGFAALVALVPMAPPPPTALLANELARLDRRMPSARNRERRFALHGDSRLLDFEGLLYLLRLLSRFPDLAGIDPATPAEVEAIVSPLPSGDLADRAAAVLRHRLPSGFELAADQRLLQHGSIACPIQPPAEPAAVPDTAAPQASGLAPGWEA